jgi:hypothetical protein
MACGLRRLGDTQPIVRAGDELHDSGIVEQKDRGAVAAQAREDRVWRSVVDVLLALGAGSVRETIEPPNSSALRALPSVNVGPSRSSRTPASLGNWR